MRAQEYNPSAIVSGANIFGIKPLETPRNIFPIQGTFFPNGVRIIILRITLGKVVHGSAAPTRTKFRNTGIL